MKIFLGDLVHSWGKNPIQTIPLNVGYVATYASKYLSKDNIDCSFTLFKDPTKMIEAIKRDKPNVVGLSYYMWNMELNRRVFDVVKEYVPNSLKIGGGPCFTKQNANEKDAKLFFSRHNNCDAFVVNQGEKGFVELIKTFYEVGSDLKKFREIAIPGSLINDLKNHDKVLVGNDIGTLLDLNDIPSPYLNGTLDPFFEGPYIPVLETNRSCPYRCTFCAWGIGTAKLRQFEEERVLREIEYFTERCKSASILIIADANFGILERDAKFAAKIYQSHKKIGYPYYVDVQWNKTRFDRIVKTAKEFKNIASVGASRQTLNDETLRAVKRKNLPLEDIAKMQKELRETGSQRLFFSELIIGLPYETKKTHIEANRQLIDLEFEVWNYMLTLLPGTEMDTTESRKKFFKKTVWRLIDNAYGIYDGKKVIEGQEMVIKTNTLSEDEFRYFRFFHFLLQMMWSKRWYYDYLKFLQGYEIHPVSVFDKIVEKCKKDHGEMGKLYLEFMKTYDELEKFESFDDLQKYFEKDSNFNQLKNESYGKLNMLYTYKTILNHREAFNKLLIEIAKEYAKNLDLDVNYFTDVCEEILLFQNTKFVQIDNEWNINPQITETFKYDVLEWKENGYKKINKLQNQKKYKFYLSEKQHKALNKQLKQYKSKNINSALRNMTVYTSPEQFFYSVKS